MVVHLGVILIAVAFATSQSYSRSTELRLKPGDTARFGGHTFVYRGTGQTTTDQTVTLAAHVEVDGQRYDPALKLFRSDGTTVPTPSVRTSLAGDVYLTLEKQPETGDVATIKVLLMPLVVWLWIGGGMMGFGTILAAFPGRRRKPTAPTSAVVRDEPPAAEPELVSAG
jgi:cytochrome c-type biogenesis protein CcmF